MTTTTLAVMAEQPPEGSDVFYFRHGDGQLIDSWPEGAYAREHGVLGTRINRLTSLGPAPHRVGERVAVKCPGCDGVGAYGDDCCSRCNGDADVMLTVASCVPVRPCDVTEEQAIDILGCTYGTCEFHKAPHKSLRAALEEKHGPDAWMLWGWLTAFE